MRDAIILDEVSEVSPVVDRFHRRFQAGPVFRGVGDESDAIVKHDRLEQERISRKMELHARVNLVRAFFQCLKTNSRVSKYSLGSVTRNVPV